MKYYIIEPKYKKSLIEYEHYVREDGARIVVETLWRGGSFMLTVPETESEIKELLGDAYDEDDVEYYTWLPEEGEDYIELDDYQYEMLGTFDGCAEDYNFYNMSDKIDEEAQEEMMEVLQEEGNSVLWDENPMFEGFEVDSCYYEIHGEFVLTECDENGKIEE
jgi:hypothetical protein